MFTLYLEIWIFRPFLFHKQSSSMQSSDSFLPTSQEGQASSVTQECLWLQGAGALWKTDGNVEMSVFLACYEFRGEAAAGFWSSVAWRIRPAASGFLSAPFWQRAGHQSQTSLREARCEGSHAVKGAWSNRALPALSSDQLMLSAHPLRLSFRRLARCQRGQV